LEKIREDYLASDLISFNYNQIDVASASYEDLYAALVTLPMMSDYKINVIENLDRLALSDKQLDEVVALSTDSIGCINLFVFDNKKSKAINRLKKNKVEIIAFEKLQAGIFHNWVGRKFREYGKKIDSQTLEYFVNCTMYSDRNQTVSLYHVENEIKKIVSLSASIISIEDLQKTMIMPLEMNVFSLTDHLVKGDLATSMEKLSDLIAKGHDVHELMPLLTKQYHNMALGKALNRKGHSNKAIMEILNFKSDYPVKLLLGRVSSVSAEKLTQDLAYCLDFESRLKSTGVNKRAHIENLILKIAR
jgi:DNA polymerase-3 subunit delta